MQRVLMPIIQHTVQWGMVWWGLLFIGSVLNAIGTRALPDANTTLIAVLAAGIGLALGVTAKVRGRWI